MKSDFKELLENAQIKRAKAIARIYIALKNVREHKNKEAEIDLIRALELLGNT